MMKLQLRLSGTAEGLFNEMRERLNVEPKEMVLDALALYHFAIDAVRKGQRVGAYDPKTKEFTGIATPILQSHAKKAAYAHARERA